VLHSSHVCVYNITNAAKAAAPRPKNDWLPSAGAALVVCCAGLIPEPDGATGTLPVVPVVPEGEEEPPFAPLPEDGPDGVFEPAPAAWPGLRFSGAVAARATKEVIVLLPEAGLRRTG
jgi:hypothetical protein